MELHYTKDNTEYLKRRRTSHLSELNDEKFDPP